MNSKNNTSENDVIEYLKTHSISCTMKDMHVGFARLTKIMNKHNIPHRSTSEEVALTKAQIYGDPSYNNRESAAKTKEERYGSSTYCNPDKIKQTKLEHFGNASFVNPEKAKETNLKRYGVGCTLHNPDVAEKVKQTNLEKYGDEFYFKSEAFKEKHEKHHREWEEKTRQTVMRRYGKPYIFMTDECKQRIKSTIQERYGVDYFCQTGECRKHSNNSKPNKAFSELLEKYNIQYTREFPINNKSYDFLVNDSILVEINPSPTHNSTWNPFGNDITKNYHKDKRDLAVQSGYKFMSVWDWDDSEKLVKSLIKRDVVYARKCVIKEVNLSVASDFLNEYHFQSYAKSDIQIGLYLNSELISLMTFGKPRYNKNFEYELIRYCSKYSVVGGAEKLFKYFVTTYFPYSIISYCDFSKFTGNLYSDLGFNSYKCYSPSKHWYNMKTSVHITDNLLRQYGFDKLLGKEYGVFGKGTNNEDLMREHGFVEIYDCGQGTYIWKNNK